MTNTPPRSVAVVGGGLTGLVTALAIARTGRHVHHIDPDGERKDARTTAMLGPSVEMLRDLGVWDAIEPHSAPLETMRIIDGSRRSVRAPTVRFDASEIGQTEFGWNVPNAAAARALRDAIGANDNIAVHSERCSTVHRDKDSAQLVLDSGATLDVALVVGADGRRSIVREAANIATREWRYPQAALVTTFAHERPHGSVSTEFHTEHGPATQVPLPDGRSSLVWVGEPHETERRAAMSGDMLSGEIAERLAYILGAVTVDGPVQTFPMASHIAQAWGGRRTMLVGEAAHGFPPIGAQGFNLSMRDIRDCTEVQRDAADPGSDSLIEGYERLRGRDAALRTMGVDALNRSLLSDLVPVQAAKAFGLAALKALPLLRQAVMRQGFRPTPMRAPSLVLGDLINAVRERAVARSATGPAE